MDMNHDEAIAHASAAEARWMRRLCLGSYTLSEAAEILSPLTPDPVRIVALSRDGHLLAFESEGELWFPEYQFADGRVLPVIPHLLKAARDAGTSDIELALWMISPSSLFAEQDAPAAHTGRPDRLMEAVRLEFQTFW